MVDLLLLEGFVFLYSPPPLFLSFSLYLTFPPFLVLPPHSHFVSSRIPPHLVTPPSLPVSFPFCLHLTSIALHSFVAVSSLLSSPFFFSHTHLFLQLPLPISSGLSHSMPHCPYSILLLCIFIIFSIFLFSMILL